MQTAFAARTVHARDIRWPSATVFANAVRAPSTPDQRALRRWRMPPGWAALAQMDRSNWMRRFRFEDENCNDVCRLMWPRLAHAFLVRF